MTDPPWRAALVFAGVGAFLGWTTLPGLHWYDTGEFTAVAWRLSVAHAPGHPIHALVTHGVQQIPLAGGAFRGNLASALCLAAALAIFYRLLRRLAPQAAWGAAACVAVLPAVMPMIWVQGVRSEVYALQLLLSAAIGVLALDVSEGRRDRALALGLVFGLAGANHHLVGLALLPVAALAFARGVRSLRTMLLSAGGGLVGLLAYAYLPLRARAGAEVGWGLPETLGGLVDTITAREWLGAHPHTQAPLDYGENAALLAGWTVDQVGAPGAAALTLVLAVGLIGASRRARPAVVGTLVAAVAVGLTKYLYPFDPLNPDVGGYLAPMLCALLALTWVAAAGLPLLGRHGAWLVAAVLWVAAPRFDAGGRQGARAAERFARAALEDVPPGHGLVAADYATWFLGWGLRAVEGTRPDVPLLFRGRVGADWHWTRMGLLHPDDAARRGDWPGGWWLAAAVWEPGVRSVPAEAPLLLAGPERWAAVRGDGPLDFDARRMLGLHHVQHATTLAHLGRGQEARGHLEAARALVGADPMIVALEARLAR